MFLWDSNSRGFVPVTCDNRGLIPQRSRRLLHHQTMAGITLAIGDHYSGTMPLRGCWPFMTKTQSFLGRRASSWFLRSLESRLRLTLVMWQVICSLPLYSVLKFSKVDLSLRHITRLCQASVVFTAFEDLFVPWLATTLARPLNKVIQPVSALPCTQDTYSPYRLCHDS
jgi:hypothetical protein